MIYVAIVILLASLMLGVPVPVSFMASAGGRRIAERRVVSVPSVAAPAVTRSPIPTTRMSTWKSMSVEKTLASCIAMASGMPAASVAAKREDRITAVR